MMSIAFHPQTDIQSKRTIHILEDRLRAYVLDLKGNWEEHFPFCRVRLQQQLLEEHIDGTI